MASTGTPLISVVVPTYNRPELVAGAVASVLNQTVDDFECIVVDDAGPTPIDLPAHPSLIVIRHEQNRGVSAARNSGMARARGKFLTFLDDDDFFTPDRLAIGLEGVDRAPLTLCWLRYLDPEPRVAPWNRELEGNIHDVLMEGVAPNVGQALVERKRALPFDESFLGAEDIDWWMRMTLAVPVTTVQKVGYLYRRHETPRNSNTITARLNERIRLLDEHADYFAEHHRALAFQWKRIGLIALRAGDGAAARRAFARSLRLRPAPRTAWHVMRSLTARTR
jgi:glycosyltransferase involved in cell wall biosynthesis